MDEFEKRLARQRLKEIPHEWRAEILAAAGEARASRHPSRATGHSWLSTLVARLSAILWPSPVAWAGLAVVWILIFAVDFSVRDKAPMLVEKSGPPSQAVMAQLQQQQRLLAELMGPRDVSDADRSKPLAPRPRSERVEFLAA